VAPQVRGHVAGQLSVAAFAWTVPTSAGTADVSYDSTWIASSFSFFTVFSRVMKVRSAAQMNASHVRNRSASTPPGASAAAVLPGGARTR